MAEIAIVIALANLFSAFSSPFLSAVLTAGVVVVGRSADTLARMPTRVFGDAIVGAARVVAHVVPNLMVYVPPRPLMTGELPGHNFLVYLGKAAAMSAAWVVVLLLFASLLFHRRDFT
jgi:Cu-processing system permease protein